MDAGIQEATVTSDGGLNQRLAKIWRELNGFNIYSIHVRGTINRMW